MRARSLRNGLLLYSTIAMGVLAGYGRRAYGACTNVGGSNFLCSGASTAQTISAAGATVTTQPGFSITTVGTNGLTITGSGDLSYTDVDLSFISAVNGNGLNITTTASVPGSITINMNGVVNALNYGVRGRNQGTGAMSVTVNGDVTSSGTGATSRGIVALNFGSTLDVTTGVGADIRGARYGILARNYGAGATSVTVNGDVTAQGTTGLDTALVARGNANVTVTSAAGTHVVGQETGMFVRSDGTSGAVSVTVNGDVTGTNDDGIYLRSGNSGAIDLTVASTATVTSNGTQADDFAIDTSTFFAAAATLRIAGTLNGGAGGAVRLGAAADRFELRPTAVVNGIVDAAGGTDTFVLGGTGSQTFDVSTIGPAQQYRNFEIFQKEDASHWTLSGTNTVIPAFAVNGGILTVTGSMPNTPFTVNAATLTLTGTGHIQSVNLANSAGIFDISGTTAGTSITSLSGVAGSQADLGTQTLTLSNASGTFAGVINGSGGFVLNAGTERLTGASLYTGPTTVNGGTLVVDGSIATSSTLGVNAGGTIAGTGILPATSIGGGTLSPGNPLGTTGTIGVQGNLTFAPASTYLVDISPATSDRTVATGTAALAGRVLVNPQVGTYPRNTTYTILTTTAGLTGTFSALEFGASAFLCACLSYDANNVYLTITSTALPFAGVGVTQNQVATGGAIEHLGTGNSIYDVIVLGSAAQARAAFDLLSGEVHASVPGLVLYDAHYVRDALVGRMRQPYGSGGGRDSALMALGSSAPFVASLGQRGLLVPPYGLGHGAKAGVESIPFTAVESPLATWGQAVGAWGDLDGNGNAATLRRSLGGIISGVDATFERTWRLGLAAGYTHSSLDVGQRSSSGSVDGYHLAIYGGGQLGAIGLRTGAAYSWNDVETARNIAFAGGQSCCTVVFSDNLKTSYSAQTTQVFGELGYAFDAGAAAFEPYAGIAYVNLANSGFTEAGGAAALNASGQSYGATFTTLGLRAGTTLTRSGGISLLLHGALGWRHAFGDVTPQIVLAFASNGLPFEIGGVPIAENSLLADAGLTAHLAKDSRLSIAYSGQFASDARDQAIRGTFSVGF